MTTIAEFLNKTSNNFSGYLYKEADATTDTPNLIPEPSEPDSPVAVPSTTPVSSAPAPQKPGFFSFINNMGTGAVNVAGNVMGSLIGQAAHNQISHGSVLPEKINNAVTGFKDGYTYATLNDDEQGYNAIMGQLQGDPNYDRINLAIGTDPDRRAKFMGAIRPVINDYVRDNGGSYTGIQNNPKLRQGLIDAVTPVATGVVADYALGDSDFVPGDGDDRTQLINTTWGNSPIYANVLNGGYQDGDYSKTNTAIFPMINALIDDDLGIQAVDYYSQLNDADRANSGIHTVLQGVTDTLRKYGLDERADEIDTMLKDLSANIGVKGSRWATNAQIHAVLKQKLIQAKADIAKAMQHSQLYKDYGERNPYKYISEEDKAKIQANAQSLRDNPWDDGYYGLLSNPDVRRAVQYAAPWLAYGVPLASLASMMGNNSLWPIILLGGLGSGALGYGGKGLFGEDFIQGADKFFNTVNSPLSQLASMFSPEMARDINNLTNSQSKATPAAPEQVSTVPGATSTQSDTGQEFTGEDPFLDIASNDRGLQGNQTTYYQGGGSYPGSAYAGYGQQAPSYYVNQGYNPMHVGSQFLGYA